MKKIIYVLLSIWLIFLFTGCTSSSKNLSPNTTYKTAKDKEIAKIKAAKAKAVKERKTKSKKYRAKAGKSKIIFLRPSDSAFLIDSSIFEIKNNKPKVIGVMTLKSKIVHDTNAGKHLFMVVGENADFISVNLNTNETYYAIVEPTIGKQKAKFSLRSTKNIKQSKLDYYLEECKTIKNSDTTKRWAKRHKKTLQKKYDKYYKRWLKKK